VSRTVEGFRAINVSEIPDVDITLAPSQAYAVELIGEADVLPFIRTRLVNDALVIDVDPEHSVRTRKPLRAHISTPALYSVQVSRAVNAKVNAVEGARVTLASHDASSLEVERVASAEHFLATAKQGSKIRITTAEASGETSLVSEDASKLSADLRTSKLSVSVVDGSKMEVRGTSAELKAELREAAELDASRLTSQITSVRASDASNATVCPQGSLEANATEASQVAKNCRR
jgi:hypothetical protein